MRLLAYVYILCVHMCVRACVCVCEREDQVFILISDTKILIYL